jgi:hypothetical protein
VLDGEPYVLRAQGTEDQMRPSYVSDIVRVERRVDAGLADAGAAVLLANVPQLWRPRTPSVARGSRADAQFSGTRTLSSRARWDEAAVPRWRTAKLPEDRGLADRYVRSWR